MPNLQHEVEQLRMADAHIAAAEVWATHLLAELGRQQVLGGDASSVQATLHAAMDGLEQFRLHRDLIASTIESIQDGSLPST